MQVAFIRDIAPDPRCCGLFRIEAPSGAWYVVGYGDDPWSPDSGACLWDGRVPAAGPLADDLRTGHCFGEGAQVFRTIAEAEEKAAGVLADHARRAAQSPYERAREAEALGRCLERATSFGEED